MCGIIGCIGADAVTDDILAGLSNLEYRGYDSAGVAVLNGEGLDLCKREGRVQRLKGALAGTAIDGSLGIGHTRWSTHGPPTDENAHPHTDCFGRVAVVHNGIIENHEEFRERLSERGHQFTSETDTEVIPHLIEDHLVTGEPPETAFRRAVAKLEGSYAIAAIVRGIDALFATREGSPLVLGVGDGANYLASDVPAFLEFTDDVVYLEDGDVLRVTDDGYHITDADGYKVDRPVKTVEWTPEDAEKDGYDHYMLKEIHEQPMAVERTLRGRVGAALDLDDWVGDTVAAGNHVHFVACGTSYHAALFGEQLLRKRGVPAQTTLASEFVSSPPPLDDETLVVGVTQSGETADTLAALREARDSGARTLACTNVIGSTAARECESALFIRAGPEIGVAATKTFSSQVMTLTLLADHVTDGPPAGESYDDALTRAPEHIETVIERSTAHEVAREFSDASAYFFVGRDFAHPVALEGALKLKEISYEHAEGFPAGELKHGPLALVTPETPVVALVTGRHVDKMRGTVEEVRARGAPVIAVSDGTAGIADESDAHLEIPDTYPAVAGVLANVQLQLFAYHTARLLDRPVDKPRNLAKSVTVE